jgi:DNA-binding PadR family transcriptional regulator
MADRRRELSGADIAAASKLKSGTLYPILARLEEAGWLSSRWEAGDPVTLGRPRRRYYRVTAEGAKNVRAVARDFAPIGRLAWT